MRGFGRPHQIVPSGTWRRLEQLDRILIRVQQLHLLSAWPADDVAAETDAVLPECGHDGSEILNGQDESIPTAGLLRPIRERTRSRASRPAQQHIERSE